MSESALVGIIAYIQIGLFILGYLFHRGLREIRGRIVALEANHESLLHKHQARLDSLEAEADSGNVTRKTPPPKVGADPAKRKKVIEMAEQGGDPAGIAAALKMQTAEVQLLLKIDALKRERARGATLTPSAEPAFETEGRRRAVPFAARS